MINKLNNNGYINNITLNDNSNANNYKLLSQCDINELQKEYSHRQKLLNDEINNKKYRLRKFSISFAIASIFASILLFFNGFEEISKFIIAVGGLVVPLIMYFQNVEQKTEFETRQINTLNEIAYLLRERGL